MAQLPESPHTTSAQIIRWYASKPQQHRPHMGASLIGHACDRYIWLTWRWALKPEFDGRMLRLFKAGQDAEPRFIQEMRDIGATVWEVDPDTGDQWRVSACNGHFAGSLDGVAKGLPEAPKTPAVIECKTHNDKSFKALLSKGVQGAKPQHHDQMMVYMGLMQLERALYVAENKNDSSIYTEWVHFDKARFDQLIARAQRLIDSPAPPLRISTDAEFFECKWCGMWKHCHGQVAAEANCRTCCHASAVENAQWRCAKHDKGLDYDDQVKGCEQHLLIPDLVPYGDVQDGTAVCVVYRHKTTGDFFVNGPEGVGDYGPNFSSAELHNTPGPLMGDLAAIKCQVPGSKVVSGGVANPYADLATAFDDIATNPDDIPVKADHPSKAAERKKATAAAKALMKK